jgi:hypothetical protein
MTTGTFNHVEPQPAVAPERRKRMIKWAGVLIVVYGIAHTIGALTALGAAGHADVWFSRDLWGEDLSDMSPAMSAYWLSVNSFGPPLVLVGLTVWWLHRRAMTPPAFIPWSMICWLVAGTVMAGPGVGQDLVLLAAAVLLLVADARARRPEDRHHTAPVPHHGTSA